jgi:hypothetical protein
MPIDLATVEKAFRATIRTLLAMPANSVHRANQFNPPPAGGQSTQFATVLVTEVDSTGSDDVTYESADSGFGTSGYGQVAPSEDVVEVITGMRHFTASVQFFRGNAKFQAMRLKTLLQSSNGLQQLQAAGIGLGKMGPIRDLSKVTDTYFEQRSHFDVEFYVVNQEQVDMSTFGTFPVSITTDSQ